MFTFQTMARKRGRDDDSDSDEGYGREIKVHLARLRPEIPESNTSTRNPAHGRKNTPATAKTATRHRRTSLTDPRSRPRPPE